MKFSATITLQYDTIFSPFSNQDWQKGMDWCRDSGLDGVEICISNYQGLDLHRIKAELDQRGLECSTISTGQARGLEGISLIGLGSQATKSAQQRLCQHIDGAAILGSKVTIGLLRGLGGVEPKEKELADLAEAMKPVVDYADQNGVTLILEAINRYETVLLNSAQATMEFIEQQLGAPDCVGVLWDLFHANIEDPTFFGSIDCMGKRLKHIHLADSNRMFPGYGHIDFAGILGYVKGKGFTEYASFECLNRPTLETVLTETKDWVAAMRNL